MDVRRRRPAMPAPHQARRTRRAAAAACIAAAVAAVAAVAGPAVFFPAGPAESPDSYSILPEAHASDRPCRVWIRGQQLNIVRDGDGNPRNNPDGTLYPGDAFYYAFYYGFSGCIGQYVAQPVSAYRDIMAQPSGHSSGTGYVSTGATSSCFGATGGTDELGQFGRTSSSCGGISKTVYGFELHCSGSGKDRKCRIFVRSATAAVIPRVKAPIVEVDLREHTLADSLGYPAANRDMTNYVWDPIAVEHEAAFQHRDEREGTITFEYDRSFGPLKELGGFERDRRGTGTLEHDPIDPATRGLEFRPYRQDVRNGGGMYAYAAQDDSSIGRHDLSYTVRVLNEGRQINTHSNSTGQLVVSYEPRYDHHPYPVLADMRQYAYDDRHAVAMLYHGSYGGGASDEPVIHPDRRSMLAGFNQTTRVGSSALPGEARELDPALMEWDGTAHINGTDEDPFTSLGEHAMFLTKGYGVLRLSQEVSGLVVDRPGANRWTDLVWTENSVTAGEFAGSMNHSNLNYTYAYPPEPMGGTYTMKAYGRGEAVGGEGDGEGGGGDDGDPCPPRARCDPRARVGPSRIDDDAGLSVTATPVVSFGGMPPWNSTVQGDHGGAVSFDPVTFWLDDYMRAKTMRETGDARFVQAVLADTHGRRAAAAAAYGGTLEAWLPKTALEYRPGHLAAVVSADGQEFTELGGGTVKEIELPDDDTDYDHPFLRLPRHLALAAVPYTEFYMTAATPDADGMGTPASRNRTIAAYPDYLAEHVETVNIDEGNRLDVRRFVVGDRGTSPTIFLSVDSSTFGSIVRAEIDGQEGRTAAGGCGDTCSLVYSREGVLRAYNEWGGSAAGWVNASDAEWYKDPTEGIEGSMDVFIFAAAIAIVGYIVYRAVRAVARAHEDPVE